MDAYDIDMDICSYTNEYNESVTDSNCTEIIPETSPLGPNQVAALVCYSLVFLLGVPGNGLVVWVTGFRMPRSVNTTWFLQLALADLLCCLSLPLLMVPLSEDQHWSLGPLACKLLTGLLYLTMYCSVLLLVVISLDRWLLVSQPVWCQNWRRPRWAGWLCVAVWLLALICTTPHFVYTTLNPYAEKLICMAVYEQRTAWIVIMVRFVLGFLTPVLVIVACHWVVYSRATETPARRQNQRNGSSLRSRRTRRVICAVVLCFVACWLPLHLVDMVVIAVPRNFKGIAHLRLAQVLTLCLAYLNSCLNPLLYVCLGRGFKDSLSRSLRSVLNFLSEDHSHVRGLGPSISYSHTRSTTENTMEKV